jgi:hypothetical protein
LTGEQIVVHYLPCNELAPVKAIAIVQTQINLSNDYILVDMKVYILLSGNAIFGKT